MMKVMVGHFVGDTHKAITAIILLILVFGFARIDRIVLSEMFWRHFCNLMDLAWVAILFLQSEIHGSVI
jgi:hypothetical protein